MNKLIRAHIFISGRVQNVFFRHNTRKKANELGVFGLVRNLSDGRVEIVVEGEKEKVENLTVWAKKGPFLAKVSDIEVESQEHKGEFTDFEIR